MTESTGETDLFGEDGTPPVTEPEPEQPPADLFEAVARLHLALDQAGSFAVAEIDDLRVVLDYISQRQQVDDAMVQRAHEVLWDGGYRPNRKLIGRMLEAAIGGAR